MVNPNIKGKEICRKCGKPRIDINGVENCDFCLQALTECELVDYACCGHGEPGKAYISFKDGRRWVLDGDFSVDESKTMAELLREMEAYDDR